MINQKTNPKKNSREYYLKNPVIHIFFYFSHFVYIRLIEHFFCNVCFLYPPLSTGLLQEPFLQDLKVP